RPGESLDAIGWTRHCVESLGIRLPSPDPCSHAQPDVALAVLVERHHPAAKPGVVSETANVACANHAKPRVGRADAAGPQGAFTILEKPEDTLIGKLRIFSEPASVPTRQAVQRADPQRPVTSGEQSDDVAGRKMLVGRRLPRNGLDAVEAEQAEF